MATQGSAAPETGAPRQADASTRPGQDARQRRIVVLHPDDGTGAEPDPDEAGEPTDRLGPARGIAMGIIIAALFWAAVAFLVLRARR
jgi:hypothetical protein